MNFHNGKIYKLPDNLYFYKINQCHVWYEYCKKFEKILKTNKLCIKYRKNIISFLKNDESYPSDNNELWINMKKIL